MKLVVERSKWLRGEGSDASAMFRWRDQKMCCLGFLGLRCGYTVSEMNGIGTPFSVMRRAQRNTFPEGLFKTFADRPDTVQNPDLTFEMMRINDHAAMNDTDREAKLTELFKQAGIEVQFVD